MNMFVLIFYIKTIYKLDHVLWHDNLFFNYSLHMITLRTHVLNVNYTYTQSHKYISYESDLINPISFSSYIFFLFQWRNFSHTQCFIETTFGMHYWEPSEPCPTRVLISYRQNNVSMPIRTSAVLSFMTCVTVVSRLTLSGIAAYFKFIGIWK